MTGRRDVAGAAATVCCTADVTAAMRAPPPQPAASATTRSGSRLTPRIDVTGCYCNGLAILLRQALASLAASEDKSVTAQALASLAASEDKSVTAKRSLRLRLRRTSP